MKVDHLWESKQIRCPGRSVGEKYNRVIATQGLGHDEDLNRASKLNITYTPMHGVGNEFMAVIFKMAGLKVYIKMFVIFIFAVR